MRLNVCFRHHVVWATLLFLGACGSGTENASSDAGKTQALTAETLGEQVSLSVAEYLTQEPFALANRKNGSRQAQICTACHSFSEGGPNMIGPALYGFFGRGVGEQAGFDYSDAIQSADFIWTPRALDAWLAQPGLFLPGNRMTFVGVFRKTDRDDLIAFLLEETSATGAE